MSEIATGKSGAAAGGDVVPLALLAGYKVRWNRKTVARDIVQNFFDAAEDFGDVRIDTATPRPAHRAPRWSGRPDRRWRRARIPRRPASR